MSRPWRRIGATAGTARFASRDPCHVRRRRDNALFLRRCAANRGQGFDSRDQVGAALRDPLRCVESGCALLWTRASSGAAAFRPRLRGASLPAYARGGGIGGPRYQAALLDETYDDVEALARLEVSKHEWPPATQPSPGAVH